MILLAALLVLAAVGLLLAGLDQGSADLQWGSFAASGLAAVLLVVSEVRSRRQGREETAGAPTRSPAAAPAVPASPVTPDAGEDVEVRRALPPPVPPSSPAIPRVGGPVSGSGLGALAGPSTGPGVPARQPAAPPDRRGRSTGAHSATDLPRVTGSGAVPPDARPPAPLLGADGEPPAEEVEVTDLLLVLDLTDEVLVVDEHPRYHLAGCPHLAGSPHLPGMDTIALPMVEARTDGFTPCGTCTPDRVLAGRERSRRSA